MTVSYMFILHFPIYFINLHPFCTFDINNSSILVHLHKLYITTFKFNNFLSVMINYKLKFYKVQFNNSSKLISLVHKSNRKQRSQKGSGRSRVGSLKSSIHKGGGVIFGPKPKFSNLKINNKEWIYVYKSIILNKRSNILWFFINKTVWQTLSKKFFKILIRHLGISHINKISFIVVDKYILYTSNYKPKLSSNLKLLDLINSKYIIYFI